MQEPMTSTSRSVSDAAPPRAHGGGTDGTAVRQQPRRSNGHAPRRATEVPRTDRNHAVTPPTRPRAPGRAPGRSFVRAVARRAGRTLRPLGDDAGAATAEYAIATMAAVAFAGLLVVIMRSDEVRELLTDLVRRALTIDV